MGTTDQGIGKSPEAVDAQQPTDDQVLEHIDQQQADTEAVADDSAPSRHDLHQIILDQQEQIDAMAERIDDLEQQVDEVEYETDTMQEVAEQFRNGEIGGDAGAEFLQEFVSVPPSDSLINARSNQLFFQIIRERRVGKPVRSKDVVAWLDFHDSSNPSVKAKRVMERLKRHREDGHYIGKVSLGKHRGQNCIWLNRQ